MYFSLFKFLDSGLFTANLVSSLNCYWIISDCKQVEILYKQGSETWNCSSVWVAIFKVSSKWSGHWGEKSEQIFTSLKVLFSWNTFGQAMCGVSMYWVSLEALLAVVCPGVSEQPPWTCVVASVWQRAAVALSVLFRCFRRWRRARECQVCRMGELIKKHTTCQINNKEITLEMSHDP